MEGPAGALLGVTALGMGALIAYGAYRDVPIFGPSGLLTGTLQTGKLPNVVKAPASSGAGKGGAAGSASPAATPWYLEWTLGTGTRGFERWLTPAGLWTWITGK